MLKTVGLHGIDFLLIFFLNVNILECGVVLKSTKLYIRGKLFTLVSLANKNCCCYYYYYNYHHCLHREAIWKYNSFRQRCNAFFMDIVSQLCFADGTPPNQEVVERLMTYVTRETEEKDKKMMQTKRLTAFQGDGIDPSPVIRSVLLQLLLQSR